MSLPYRNKRFKIDWTKEKPNNNKGSVKIGNCHNVILTAKAKKYWHFPKFDNYFRKTCVLQFNCSLDNSSQNLAFPSGLQLCAMLKNHLSKKKGKKRYLLERKQQFKKEKRKEISSNVFVSLKEKNSFRHALVLRPITSVNGTMIYSLKRFCLRTSSFDWALTIKTWTHWKLFWFVLRSLLPKKRFEDIKKDRRP